MWYLNKITIKNLLSHSDTEYSFVQSKVTSITGTNLDDDGAISNGSGKSGLVEAITLAITGEVGRDINKEDFITTGRKYCEVDLYLTNNHMSRTMHIYRKFYANSNPAEVKIFVNDIHNEQITSVNEANKHIYEQIGISREDLLNYYLIGQGSTHSFFKANDTDKKKIISRFTNFTSIETIIAKLEKDKAVVLKEIDELQLVESNIQGKIESIRESIEYENNNSLKDVQDSIKRLKEEKTSLDEKITRKQKEITLLDVKIKQCKAENVKLTAKIIDLTDKETLLSGAKVDLKEVQKLLDDNERQMKVLNMDLNGHISCPNCKKPFSPVLSDKGMSIIQAKDKIENLKIYQGELEDLQKTLEIQIEELEEEIEQNSSTESIIKRNKTNISSSLEDKEELEEQIQKINKNIVKINSDINAKQNEIKGNNRIVELNKSLKKNEKELLTILAEIDVKSAEETDILYLIHHFSKKGFMTFLANKTIKVLEGLVNSYLYRFNTNLSVLINGYTKLKSGEIREKIDVFVVRNGKDKGKFNKYSGGEKQRINIAGVLALQKLINMSCGERGLDFLCIDEIFDDGLDDKGQKECINILEQSRITTLIISHKSLPTENCIDFVKKNGISKIHIIK